MSNGMKQVKGRIISSRRPLDDWDEDACLCQHQVPDDKRIDVQQIIYDEKRKKHRWRNMIRYHVDCPIHGSAPEETECPED